MVKVTNIGNVNVNGTHRQGYLKTSYVNIVTAFGEPHCSDGHKTDAEWGIEFEDGEVATIYNWKNGYNYCGADGLLIASITEWNIGGHSKKVVARIKEIVNR